MKMLATDDLRAIVTDPAELAKGARVLDEGGLANLARHGDRIYADAAGMMAMPYKVMVTLGERIAARCTCMAARTRPFCKHAAALLVAWARAPEAFAESERAPVTEEKRKRAVKKGKRDAHALMADGVAKVLQLVREMAATGVASTGEGRAGALHGLAEGLRAGGLRRLAGRVHRLADLLDGGSDSEAFAELMADLLLTARKVEKHLGGEPIDDRHVEELIGKTWRKNDREPIDGLDLVELAAGATTTPDGFVVREQRLLDVATGAHYADKQIVPQFLARRTAARPSLGGQLARGASGRLYPGYPPRRLDLEARGELGELDRAALDRLLAAALPGAKAALAAFQEHRKDVFAPDALPVTVRVDVIAVVDGRLYAIGPDDEALHLPASAALEDQLAGALRDVQLFAIVGDLALDRALPVLTPLAVITDRGLRRLAPVEPDSDLDAGGWAAQARAAGASAAAVSLAEVRGELGDLLAQGIASFTARAVDPLAARLRELGLERPAALLAGIAAKPEGERLEDVIRVHQVLGVALIRVVGTTHVDIRALAPVPTCESVFASPEGPSRWSRLIRARRELAEVPTATLATTIYPWWANGWLAPSVAAAVAREPGAIETARAVLADTHAGRTARMTAIRVLVLADPAQAARHITLALGRHDDPALGSFALDTIDAMREAEGDADAAAHRRTRRRVAIDLAGNLRHAGAADERRRAALALGDLADDVASAALRAAWIGDSSDDVREAAALSLGRRGDPAAIDSFVDIVNNQVDGVNKGAALGLAASGDARGIPPLINALIAGRRPALIGECLRLAGKVALAPLREAVAKTPALSRRKVVKELLA